MFLVIEWFSLSRGDKQIFRNQSRDIKLKSCITFPQTYIFCTTRLSLSINGFDARRKSLMRLQQRTLKQTENIKVTPYRGDSNRKYSLLFNHMLVGAARQNCATPQH